MPIDNFDPMVIPVFLTSWGARFYAWRARRRGFKASIRDYGYNNRELGGRYEVTLTPDGQPAEVLHL